MYNNKTFSFPIKTLANSKLYNKLIRDYTYKQWNKYPEELKPSVLARIPIRNKI